MAYRWRIYDSSMWSTLYVRDSNTQIIGTEQQSILFVNKIWKSQLKEKSLIAKKK